MISEKFETSQILSQIALPNSKHVIPSTNKVWNTTIYLISDLVAKYIIKIYINYILNWIEHMNLFREMENKLI